MEEGIPNFDKGVELRRSSFIYALKILGNNL